MGDVMMMQCLFVVQVTVEQRDRAMNVSQEVRTGVLFMVDLAGSERAAVTQVSGILTCIMLNFTQLHVHVQYLWIIIRC